MECDASAGSVQRTVARTRQPCVTSGSSPASLIDRRRAPHRRRAPARPGRSRPLPPRGRRIVTGSAKPWPASAPKAALAAAVAQAPVVQPRRSARRRPPLIADCPRPGRAHRAWRMRYHPIMTRTLPPPRRRGSADERAGDPIVAAPASGAGKTTRDAGPPRGAAPARVARRIVQGRPRLYRPRLPSASPPAARPTTSTPGRCASRPWPG